MVYYKALQPWAIDPVTMTVCLLVLLYILQFVNDKLFNLSLQLNIRYKHVHCQRRACIRVRVVASEKVNGPIKLINNKREPSIACRNTHLSRWRLIVARSSTFFEPGKMTGSLIKVLMRGSKNSSGMSSSGISRFR